MGFAVIRVAVCVMVVSLSGLSGCGKKEYRQECWCRVTCCTEPADLTFCAPRDCRCGVEMGACVCEADENQACFATGQFTDTECRACVCNDTGVLCEN